MRNKASIFRQLGVNPVTERQIDDYYATDPIAIDRLLAKETFSKEIIECCVGGGHLATRLEQYEYIIDGYDIVDRGYPNTTVIDFLNDFSQTNIKKDIITNPPYTYAQEFVRKALSIIADGQKVAMLLRLNFLESIGRQSLFQEFPPQKVYVATKRINCAKNADFASYPSTAVAYAWFVWQKGNYGQIVLDFC